MEQTYTDKEFCKIFKIGRTASANWRESGIVGYIKLPNGQIRYRQKHVDELVAKFEKSAFQNGNSAVKGRVVNIGVSESRDYGTMS